MIEQIPVTVGFNSKNLIGILSIDTSKLPNTADYCFGIGVQIIARDIEGNISNSRLVEVSLIPNAEYKRYLNENTNG